MYVFFRIEGWPDGTDACLRLLEGARVGLAPGELFGAPGWLRMCVCRDAAQLATALGRIEALLAA